LGLEEGRDPLLSEGTDEAICHPPQGKAWREVEELPAPTLLLWGNERELTDTLCMLIDDIPNEKALDKKGNDEATLKVWVDPTISGEELLTDAVIVH
jgi:hypothetical protein